MESMPTGTRPVRRRKKKIGLAPREMRRLLQLGVCVAVFLLVFIGRGIFPERMEALRQNALHMITTHTDFSAAFAEFGQSVREGVPVFGAVEDLWQQVFGKPTDAEPTPMEGLPDYLFGREVSAVPLVIPSIRTPALPGASSKQEVEVTPEPAPEPEPEPDAPPASTDAPTMPENATDERVALGIGETVTPVMGVLSSAYGYRDHPVDGAYKFHYGADIFAEKGTPVLAFADGVVDYIGESPVYGLYMQLRHDGGVTTFYAHCDKLLLGQGKQVTAGQQIAVVGDSGNATGPHLHLELKKDNQFCNPLHYIETL